MLVLFVMEEFQNLLPSQDPFPTLCVALVWRLNRIRLPLPFFARSRHAFLSVSLPPSTRCAASDTFSASSPFPTQSVAQRWRLATPVLAPLAAAVRSTAVPASNQGNTCYPRSTTPYRATAWYHAASVSTGPDTALPPRTTPTAHQALLAPLADVDARVLALLREVRDAPGAPKEWSAAIAACEKLATSPKRHILASQLVLLGTLGASSLNSAENAAASLPADGPQIRAAAAMELLHLFMQVQDDVMDDAGQRRGRVPLHRELHARLAQHKDGRTAGNAARLSVHLTTVVADALHSSALVELASALATAEGGPGTMPGGAMAALQAVGRGSATAAAFQFRDVLGWRDALDAGGADESLEQRAERFAHYERSMVDFTVSRFAVPLGLGLALSSAAPTPSVTDAVAEWCHCAGRAFQVGSCRMSQESLMLEGG